jgi:uncharacterized protein YccT (UPF0319 family)
MRILLIITTCFLFYFSDTIAQQKVFDEETKYILDSLDNRIMQLEKSIKQMGNSRDANLFRTKRDLDMTKFLRQYEELIYDEDLASAQSLIEKRTQEAEKRMDKYAIDYYKSYKSKLTRLRGQKRTRYQELFAKEKNFEKEYKSYTKNGDEYSLTRAKRMVELAIKYAQEKQMKETLKYLYRYRDLTDALIFDLNSEFDLKKLSNNESYFLKTFEPLLDSDSLEVIMKGVELANQCYKYTSTTPCKINPDFFDMQKIVAANAVADWNERQGITAELAALTGQSVIARLDSLNKEGIYQWKNLILVIGTVNFSSKSEMVRRGEAIIDADNTLLNYVRINKLAKVKGNKIQAGKTYMVSYFLDGKKKYFNYDFNNKQYQYMICYTSLINEKVTQEMIRFLPPLQFLEEINE